MSTGQPAPAGRPPALDVHVRSLDADRFLVTVVGALDLHTAPELGDALQRLLHVGAHTVLVDLSGVTFLDSTGLTCLIAAYRTTRNTGARLALIAPSPSVRNMLELTGVDRVLPSYPTPDAAHD
jgi:anti-sigma B factor antagonist